MNWLIKLIDEFKNTVIYQDRYLLILEGLKNTIIMSLLAVIIGIIIGGIISIVRYTNKCTGKKAFLSKIFEIYVNIIRGTPSVLQLMIIYYIVFKTTSLNSIIIGALAFGINSSAYTSEILRSGFESINPGQMEGGLALGLKYSQVLRKIIIPQAIKNSLPSIGNEFITLIKETAVAGYIGIMDLTKASDIIASRTYDYFLPLIIIAMIYLVITSLLAKLLKLVEKRMGKNVKS